MFGGIRSGNSRSKEVANKQQQQHTEEIAEVVSVSFIACIPSQPSSHRHTLATPANPSPHLMPKTQLRKREGQSRGRKASEHSIPPRVFGGVCTQDCIRAYSAHTLYTLYYNCVYLSSSSYFTLSSSPIHSLVPRKAAGLAQTESQESQPCITHLSSGSGAFHSNCTP